MSEDEAPRRRLPDVALPLADGGAAPVPLRARRQGTVLVLLDGAPDARDAAFLDALAVHEAELRAWDGRVLLVVREAPPVPASAAFPVLLDPTGSVAAAAGVDAPALLVSDQWGELYLTRSRDAGEGWPAVAELEQWLRFLAIRCAG